MAPMQVKAPISPDRIVQDTQNKVTEGLIMSVGLKGKYVCWHDSLTTNFTDLRITINGLEEMFSEEGWRVVV